MNKVAALLTAALLLLFVPSCGDGYEDGPGGDNGGVVNENGGEGGEGEGDEGDGY